jgi:predicted ATP-binding protein involved in virulence
VLLDELDLHLHPRWQRRVVPLLRSVFKNVQFIVTTHSPLVVAGAHASEIIRLRREGDVVTEDPNEREPGFQTATQLLTNYFDVPIAARKELVEQRRELRSLLALESVTASQRRRRDTLKRELAPYRALPTDFDGGTEA